MRQTGCFGHMHSPASGVRLTRGVRLARGIRHGHGAARGPGRVQSLPAFRVGFSGIVRRGTAQWQTWALVARLSQKRAEVQAGSHKCFDALVSLISLACLA